MGPNGPAPSSATLPHVPSLSGPTRKPLSDNAADSVVVMLHGRGSNGDDLMGLAPYLAPSLPNTAFHSPDAPYPFEDGPFGYQWYSRATPEARVEGARAVTSIVDSYVDEVVAGYGLGPDRCVLLGFSQGSIVSLHAAPRRATPLAGVVALSGAMITGDTLADELANRTPVLLVHGEDDSVLPADGSRGAADALARLGVPNEVHILPGLGHSIDQRVLELARDFIHRVLG